MPPRDKANPNGKRHATPQSLNAAIKSICDIMRRSNCAGAMKYVPELTWILFLRILDVLDKVHEISSETVDPTHVFTPSQVSEGLLLKMGEKGNDGGQFFTPREIIRVMIRVVDPQPGKTVYDPGCGTCGFLAQSYEYMREKAERAGTLTGPRLETLKRRTFYGRETEKAEFLPLFPPSSPVRITPVVCETPHWGCIAELAVDRAPQARAPFRAEWKRWDECERVSVLSCHLDRLLRTPHPGPLPIRWAEGAPACVGASAGRQTVGAGTSVVHPLRSSVGHPNR